MPPRRKREGGRSRFQISEKDREFLRIARERFKQGQDADNDQREREKEVLMFAAGKHWPPDIEDARKGKPASGNQQAIPARPCLVIQKELEPINQLLAQMEDAELGFELVPADDFADLVGDVDDTEIKTREGLARRIQRDSQADEARLWGADRGNQCGRGYWAVLTRYLPGKTRNQEIYVHKIFNQSSVTLDPNRQHFDGSDADWSFMGNDLPWDEYKAKYPYAMDGKTANPIANADDQEFRALCEDYPDWFTETKEGRSGRVVNYWYVVLTPRVVATLPDGSDVWLDELSDADKERVIDQHIDVQRKMKCATIDGVQILEAETDWPSPYQPIIEYIARPLQPFDGTRRAEGLVGPMMGAGRGFDYMVSKWVEQVGLSPVSQIMMAAGQDEGFKDEYERMNTHTLPVLHYNQMDLNGRPAPPPFKPPTNTDISAIAGSISVFDQAIQSTTQSHNPSHGKSDPALRSAKAIDAVVANDLRGDTGFVNNWARAIRQEGRVINSLLYPIYGIRPGRLASIVDPDGNVQTIMLNQPFQMNGQGKTARPQPADPNQQGAQHFKLTQNANFNVVVKVTKNFETKRQQEAKIIGDLIAAEPGPMLATFGDLWFKNQDGPGHTEMAERAKIMLDPKILAAEAAKQGGLTVPLLQAQLQQAAKHIQEQDALLKQAQTIIQTKQVEGQTKKDIAAMQEGAETQRAAADREVKLAVAAITAEAKNAIEAMRLFMEERARLGVQSHESTEAARQRGHEIGMASVEHGHAMMQQAAEIPPEISQLLDGKPSGAYTLSDGSQWLKTPAGIKASKNGGNNAAS